ncbi:MAG: thiosulfate oxidation carrier complex protein SoxZ [Methylococcales symbiont of Iophon sp. n. MRB-2018]|nr:MAG: thiosulfate oxidation carrier complex protein SoxZ [Methylococcales symbiont of Iophon sp. n. MRB-2018]KAF3979663.1 MAG: thiosulfate oxidation carrier complex protein SoxZ [Methylococcales symbiont of Iophon sp. n. MRB-2018]
MSSIKIRTKRFAENTQIRLLITHPMANGRGKNRQGKPMAAKYITVLSIYHNESKILTSHLSASIAKNPYLDFILKGGAKGDKIEISWVDNLGKTDFASHLIK